MLSSDSYHLGRIANRPIANRLGRRYGLLNAAFALAQVVVSTSTAVAHQGSLVALQRLSDPNAGMPLFDQMISPVLIGIGSCSVAGIIGVIASFLAARDTSRLTGDWGLGQRAGIIASAFGALAWLVFGVVAALLVGTDGALLVIDPFSALPVLHQAGVIAIVVVIRDCILSGIMLVIALLSSVIGASAGEQKR